MTESTTHDVSGADGRFAPVPTPGTNESPNREALRREIEAWLDSEAFTTLASAEGAQADGTLEERLAYLDGFSAAEWDFRARAARARAAGYLERNQVDRDLVDGPREELVFAAARALGLVDPRPPQRDHYDYVLVLGGLVRANVSRSQYAAHLLRSGRVSTASVAALTAFRPLARNESDKTQDEHRLLETLELPDRATEAEVLGDALADAFGLPDAPTIPARGEEDTGRFGVATTSDGARTVTLVAAPNPASSRRANTGQTMRYWAREVAHVKAGQRILFVTSAIYVPFQHAVALQNLGLPFGATVETVGVDPATLRPGLAAASFRGVNYLQELRSAVRAYRSLVRSLDENAGGRG
ncbi:hypothetical protein [Geodermatophilus normandii]|uniref:Uncharacterized protein n=1 Tax=Geodermatophilus normandii TaxID=1137989 RepID=A0A6P0GMH0_9ACTN|nr:hypothetical protein [Geodermatophilus normandii]NEM08171.1 hypothetical protein [Geodermatophilus normandii]